MHSSRLVLHPFRELVPAAAFAAARADRLFYGSFVVLVGVAATSVSLPHLPLLPLIYFSQLVNTILLAPHLVPLVLLNRDAQVVGDHDILSARWSAAAWLGIALVVSSVLTLGVALEVALLTA